MSVNIPVVNAGYLSVQNLQIARTGNATATVAAGQARDSTNVNDIVLAASVTLNAANVGINGLDTGALAASTVYALYVVGDSTNTNAAGVLLSANASAPLLPVNYDMYRKIGYIATDGSSHFLLGYWYGNANERVFVYDAIQATAITSGSSGTYANVDLSALVPAVDNIPVRFEVDWTANAAADTYNMQPYGATGDAFLAIAPVAGATAHTVVFPMVFAKLNAGKAEVSYKVSAGAVAINVAGYQYSI